jgi:hypothetical protein
MQINQAAELYHSGVIKGFSAVRPSLVEDGWLLALSLGSSAQSFIQTARGKDKVYKSFDSLSQDLKRITGKLPKSMSIQL